MLQTVMVLSVPPDNGCSNPFEEAVLELKTGYNAFLDLNTT